MRALLKAAMLSLGLAAIVLLGGAGTADARPREAAEVDAVDGSTETEARACGNAVGVLGDAEASCEGSQEARATDGDETDGGWIDADVGGATPVQANACGNAVGVWGDAEASCQGSQDARAGAEAETGGGGSDADVAGATTVQANACGNAVGALGDAEARCDGSQDARASSPDDAAEDPIEIDVLRWGVVGQGSACGNAVGALGDAVASCDGSQQVGPNAGDDGDGARTDANVGGAMRVLAGACGNALGDAEASCRGSQTSPRDPQPDVEAPPTGGGDDQLSMPPPSVLGAGGGQGSLGLLAVTGASADRFAIGLVLLVVGISSVWASGRREEVRPQR
jgi:hypothetical protein